MKANRIQIEKQIEANIARINFLQGQMKLYKKIQKRHHENNTSWYQFNEECMRILGGDTCIDQNFRCEMEFLTDWNNVLTGNKKMYANRRFYSDCNPYEIVAVKTARVFTVREMNCICTGGAYSNTWDITSDDNGETFDVSIRRTKRGHLIAIVGENGSGSHFWLSEHPHKYYDYEF